MKELNQEINNGTDMVNLVLQFPKEVQDAFFIKKEVKMILINELQERIKTLTS